MRKYLLSLFAVVLAGGICAFSVKKVAPRAPGTFAVYQLTTSTGCQELTFSNYQLQVFDPAPAPCPGAIRVCWFKLTDRNDDGLINQVDFNIIADELDVDNDCRISDDQLTENSTTYQEKA